MMVSLVLLGLLSLSPSDPRDGRELLGQMRQRAHMYRTLTFTQTTKRPGRPDETWYESARIPNTLRIDIAPMDSGRAIIFRNDSVYSFRGGRMLRSGPYVHTLLLLLGDVFTIPVDSSIARLTREGFDLSKIHEDRYDNRKVWVVGADAGDTTSSQFWIDADRLYMVRMIEHGQDGSTMDSKILQHQRINGIWVETEMVFYRNGQELQRELYNDVHVNPQLDDAIFEPATYTRPRWIP